MLTRLRIPFRAFAPATSGEATIAVAPLVPVRDMLRRFWPEARPHRGWLGLMLVLIMLGPLVETAVITLYGRLIDDVLVPGRLDRLPAIAALYLALTIASGVLGFGRSYLSTWVGERVIFQIRTRVFRHVQALPLSFFERHPLGDLLTRLTDDVDEIGQVLIDDLTAVVGYVLKIVFFTSALLLIDWRLTLLALVVAPPFWFAARIFSGKIKDISREQRRWDGAVAAVAEESLANVALVQAYNQQSHAADRFAAEAWGGVTAQLRLARLRAGFAPLVSLLELGGVLFVVAAGAWQIAAGQLTLGGLLSFLAFLSQLYGPIRGITSLINDVYGASAGADRIIELLEQPTVADPPDAHAIGRARGDLALTSVSYRYPGTARDTLRDLTVTVPAGTSLAIVGASGAGKSTLLKLLLRSIDPAAGQVTLDGEDLRHLTLESLRANLGVVLQETLLLDDTIRANIAFGKPAATDAEIIAAAKAADADQFIWALPERYDTGVGQRGRTLSGGQRQRVALARAIVRDAPVLILDEPTTGLDAAASERILAPLRRLMRNRTTIIVSHNLLTAREADQIIVLDQGQIVERGTHETLLAAGGAYAALYRLHHGAPAPTDAPRLAAAI